MYRRTTSAYIFKPGGFRLVTWFFPAAPRVRRCPKIMGGQRQSKSRRRSQRRSFPGPLGSEARTAAPCELLATRPGEAELTRLRDEIDRLRVQLAKERRDRVIASLALESERAERKRVEASLLLALQDADDWFESTVTPISCVGSGGIIRAANREQLALLGYARAEYVGHPFEDFLLEKDVRSAIRAALDGGDLPKDLQASMLKKDGTRVPVLLTCNRIGRDGRRGLRCYVECRPDVEERAERQEALARFGQLALRETSIIHLFDEASELLYKVFAVDFVEVLQQLPDGNDLLLQAGRGWREGWVGNTVIHEGICCQVRATLEREEPLVVEDLEHDERFEAADHLREHGVVSGMTVVIPGTKAPFGVLGVHTAARRRFLPHEIVYMKAVANVLAAALERRAAEERLRDLSIRLAHQRQRLDGLLTNLPAVVWESMIDPVTRELKPVFASDYIQQMMGYSKEELIEKPELWFACVHPDDRESVKRRVAECLSGAEPGGEQFRWIARDGRVVWVESTKQSIRDDQGRPVGIRGVNLDISARKAIEARMAATEERMGDILANIPSVVWELYLDRQTGELRTEFVSDFVKPMTGYSKEDFSRNPLLWIERIHPDDREAVKDRMVKMLAGTPPTGPGEARLIRRDGQIIWIQSTHRIIRDEKGEIAGIRGVTMDVTARREAEEARQHAEARFYAFMNNSPMVAVMKDDAGRYIYGNARFKDWCAELGIEWRGRRDEEMFPPEQAERFRRKDRECLEENRPTHTIEVHNDPNGVPAYWSVLRFPVPDALGRRILGTVAIDVTERRSLEREVLEISDREQQRLGQELHDGLCQHLLGVALMAKTLADRMEKSGDSKSHDVRTITDFLYEALNLARGLMKGLHTGRLDGVGGLPLALHEFVNTTGRLFGKRCTFSSSVDIEILNTDVGVHLFRIAQEATHNALKHGDPTEVNVRLARDGNDLLLIVENDGKPLGDIGQSEGMGIRTMHYRAELIDARLTIENRAGGGVVVTCRMPAGRSFCFTGVSVN